jgi:hypothetical protein
MLATGMGFLSVERKSSFPSGRKRVPAGGMHGDDEGRFTLGGLLEAVWLTERLGVAAQDG